MLSAHGVEIRSAGKTEILTRCPLCGSSDRSQHLSISLLGKGWRCLRNPAQHKGRSYSKLLSYLINVPIERAREMLGERAVASIPDADQFASSWRKQLGMDKVQVVEQLEFPKEIKPLKATSKRSDAFWGYLFDRGYSWEQAVWAVTNYDLHYALSGRYSYRITLPIYSPQNQLMTWTSRAIDSDADIRYMTLSSADAVKPPGELLLGLPLLFNPRIKARCLIVCEGPFDAIAVTTLGYRLGIWGTCIFGLELSEAQADLLSELDSRFDQMRLMLDASALLRVLRMRELLPQRCKSLAIPSGFKDPGEFIKRKEGADFIASLAS